MSSGLERLLASETNLSDLLAYFTQRDPKRWSGLVRDFPVDVVREGGAGTPKRADVVLNGSDKGTVGAVEVKLGHSLSKQQMAWYEDTLGPEVPLILTSLDSTDTAIDGVGERWVHISLADLVARWTSSADTEVATIATATHRVLDSWSHAIDAVAGRAGEGNADPLDNIRDPFLARILTRTLKPALLAEGARAAYPGTTSGGGNAILQGWAALPGAPEGEVVIAEVRWSPGRDVMDLRFGLDFGPSGQEARAAVWERAQQMDDAIRADRFIEHLSSTAPNLVGLLSTKKPSGRPAAKGEWTKIIENGFQKGDAKEFNPDFSVTGTPAWKPRRASISLGPRGRMWWPCSGMRCGTSWQRRRQVRNRRHEVA